MKQNFAAVGGLLIQGAFVFSIAFFVPSLLGWTTSEDDFSAVFVGVSAAIHISCAVVGYRIAKREGGRTGLIVILTLIFGLAALLAFLVSDSPQKIHDEIVDEEIRRREIAKRAAMQRRAQLNLPGNEDGKK